MMSFSLMLHGLVYKAVSMGRILNNGQDVRRRKLISREDAA
jgi:hypothetical protein